MVELLTRGVGLIVEGFAGRVETMGVLNGGETMGMVKGDINMDEGEVDVGL